MVVADSKFNVVEIGQVFEKGSINRKTGPRNKDRVRIFNHSITGRMLLTQVLGVVLRERVRTNPAFVVRIPKKNCNRYSLEKNRRKEAQELFQPGKMMLAKE